MGWTLDGVGLLKATSELDVLRGGISHGPSPLGIEKFMRQSQSHRYTRFKGFNELGPRPPKGPRRHGKMQDLRNLLMSNGVNSEQYFCS